MNNNTLIELLKFYNEIGIDCILEENPQGRFMETIISTSTDHIYWIKTAEQMAASAKNILELRQLIESFNGCELKNFAKNTVFSDGNPKAKIMLIGEAPGANEDLEGIPFCGASGNLLNKMLAAINLDRNTVYISNTVFWRPPSNRRPTDIEIAICRPFVEKHIALISPKILVLVGSTACYSLLSTKTTISQLRGKFFDYSNKFLQNPINATAIFHPAYLLRQPMQKRLAWMDLQLIREFIDKNDVL